MMLLLLSPVRLSLKSEPTRFSMAVRVSVPAPKVFCGPSWPRLTVTPAVAWAKLAVSLPIPPSSTSLPAPLNNKSLPASPCSVLLPLPAVSTSLPSPALMMLSPAPATSVSLPAVPVRV
ncbi:hypothetical protein D3C87_1604590 [compost metagenome]